MVDTSNPMLQLGLLGMMQPNQYSRFTGAPFPMPTFRGAPTNAMGAPITPSAGASTDPTQAYLDALANPGPVMTPGAIAGQTGPIYQGAPTGAAGAQGGFIPGPAAAAAPAAAPAPSGQAWPGAASWELPAGTPYSGGGNSPWISPGATAPSPAQSAMAKIASGAWPSPPWGMTLNSIPGK